jgi:putative membrane protein
MRDNIPEESPMTPIARRSFIAALSAASAGGAVTAARAVDALPDARFVGFAQAVNDFGVASGNLALARSGNENVRAFATRSIAEHTEKASELAKSRQEAGVA